MNDRFKNNRWYQRNSKLIFLSLFVLFFVSSSIFIIYKGLDIVKKRDINYINSSNVDYFVYLKDNNYFNTPYLNKGEKYIASLIDNIEIKYNYSLNCEEEMKGNYNYKFVGNIIVKESGKEDVLWEDVKDLSSLKEFSFDGQKTIGIDDKVTINYDYYNDVVNQFKKDYGVMIDAELVVKLVINTNLDYENDSFTIEYTPYVEIPLSEKTIEISISESKDNNIVKTITYTKYPILNYFLIIVGVIFLLIYLFLGIKVIIRIIKAIKNRNKYDMYIRKIFGNYEQIIVTTDKIPDLNDYDVLEVHTFEDLVDAQGEIHKPIIFKETRVGKEALFILLDDKRAFIYIVRLEDVKK